MSHIQGAQAFIEGCLVSDLFYISDEFRARLVDVSAKLTEDPRRSDVVFNDQELDEVFELHRVARRAQQNIGYPHFLDYAKDLLVLVCGADREDNTFFMQDKILSDQSKKDLLELLESVEPIFDLKTIKSKTDNVREAMRIHLFVKCLDKKDFDRWVVLITRKLAKSVHLSDVNQDKIYVYIAETLYESEYFKDEALLKKILPYTQAIYDMYDQCDRLNQKMLTTLMDIHAFKNFDEDMKELLRKHWLHQPCHADVGHKKGDWINQEVEALLIGQECSAQQLAIWPLNNRTADVHLYGRRVDHLVWPEQLYQQIQQFVPEQTAAWLAVWQHAATATSLKKPSQQWLKTAQQHVMPIQAEFSWQLIEWIRLILKQSSQYWRPFSSQNEPVIKGLIWFFWYVQHAEKATVLAEVVRFGYATSCQDTKSQVVAEAALYVLGQMGMTGLLQLSTLRRKSTEQKAKKTIEKMLYATAKTLKLSAEYLADLAMPEVPDFEGFVEGQSIYCVGVYRAIIRVTSVQHIEVIWKHQDKVLTDIPPAANRYSRVMKQIQQEQKALSEVLVTQNRRLEDSLVQHRVWMYPLWDNLLASHRVLSWLVRRLIWQFETDYQIQHGFYTNGQWCDVAGQPLHPLTEQTMVQLWQPSCSTVEDVLAWQQFMVNRQIVQPFKQAFRDAEDGIPIEMDEIRQSIPAC